MINKIRQLLLRKNQFLYNYNFEVEKFDTATFGLLIRYKKSFRTILVRLLDFGVYVLYGIFITFLATIYDNFGFSRFTIIAMFLGLLVLIIFIGGFLFHPRTKNILDELVRQKRLQIISEEKFNDYMNQINTAVENSKLSDEQKKETIEYNNNLR